jgi:bifunctional DNase/RNase
VEKKVKLSVLGFSFNQTQSGTYGLVLAEDNGLRRLMIIIGTPEAQSIAFVLHDTRPPRPLTHDLFVSMMNVFDAILREVFIYKYDNGVFYSRLLLNKEDGKNVIVESRTSDAIAIALRTNSPVYTTESIMQNLGIVITGSEIQQEADTIEMRNKRKAQVDYSSFTKEELDTMLTGAIEGEDYELASILRDEIKKR